MEDVSSLSEQGPFKKAVRGGGACGRLGGAGPVRGQRSELLEEAQHQVSERGPHGLVVVTDDVGSVRLHLDQRVLRLQVQDVAVSRLLHLHLTDAVLQGEGSGGQRSEGQGSACCLSWLTQLSV